jgi:hypothetical protein
MLIIMSLYFVRRCGPEAKLLATAPPSPDVLGMRGWMGWDHGKAKRSILAITQPGQAVLGTSNPCGSVRRAMPATVWDEIVNRIAVAMQAKIRRSRNLCHVPENPSLAHSAETSSRQHGRHATPSETAAFRYVISSASIVDFALMHCHRKARASVSILSPPGLLQQCWPLRPLQTVLLFVSRCARSASPRLRCGTRCDAQASYTLRHSR